MQYLQSEYLQGICRNWCYSADQIAANLSISETSTLGFFLKMLFCLCKMRLTVMKSEEHQWLLVVKKHQTGCVKMKEITLALVRGCFQNVTLLETFSLNILAINVDLPCRQIKLRNFPSSCIRLTLCSTCCALEGCVPCFISPRFSLHRSGLR